MWISYCNTHTNIFQKLSFVSVGVLSQVRRVLPSVVLVVLVDSQYTFYSMHYKALLL